MITSCTLTLLTLFSLAVPSLAHPGEHHDYASEIARRVQHNAHLSRSIAKCAGHPATKRWQKEAMLRRYDKAEVLRLARGLPSKPYIMGRDSDDIQKYEKVNHNETSQGYTLDTSADTLFSGNTSCVLTPEVTQGPYYVTGELIRSDVTEDQKGIPLHIEFQYIDVSTCEPATGLYMDLWHTNATGVYSGVVAGGNGDNNDDTNLDATFCRGLQPVSDSGVAAFDTIFPGHYSGRTTHIHILAHQGGKVLDNNTYSGGAISHVGQVFFNEDLRDLVEATEPYSSNTQSKVLNADDSIAGQEAEDGYDPFPYWAMLGDTITDGLLMWIEVGINMTADYNVTAAASLPSDGGIANENAGMGGGPGGSGGGPPSGVPPSGAMPTGAMPTGAMPTGGVPPSGSGEPPTAAFSTTSGSEGALVTSISAATSAAANSVDAAAADASNSASAAATGTSSANHLVPIKAFKSLASAFKWLRLQV